MSLVGLLTTTTLLSLVGATQQQQQQQQQQRQQQQPSEQRSRLSPVDNDHFVLVLLLNRRDLAGLNTKAGLNDDRNAYAFNDGDVIGSYEDIGGGGSSTTDFDQTNRDKRIGSLSIVNSVDVLRQRVLLELARRQAMEDQRQISENRRILDSVGKRSGRGIGNSLGNQYRRRRRRRRREANDHEVEEDEVQ